MRSESEIHQEKNYINNLQKIEMINSLGNVPTKSVLEERARDLLADDVDNLLLNPEKSFEGQPKERKIYLQGMMRGRQQALKWVLQESDDLY